MLKKFPSASFIITLSFVLAAAGIAGDLLFPTHRIDAIRIRLILDPLNLDWVFSGHSLNYNGYRYANGVTYVLLLAGAIAFVAGKTKSGRLIRFSFSLILLSNILGIVYSLYFFVFVKSFFSFGVSRMLLDLVYLLIGLLWIFVSYRILCFFNNNRSLQLETDAVSPEDGPHLVRAASIQRFLHPLIDTIGTIAVFSPLLQPFVHYNMGALSRIMLQVQQTTAEKYIILIIILFRLAYYVFFETLLGITPAKLLTGTRVVNIEGGKPAFRAIMIRTVVRLIPFEAFSFFAHDGWHDKWSGTAVVRES
ncbi:MAG TPA: RDD family protein [Mucilaginibacter sp.]|nr:RDD family protein [Mucilaginibacter sp.]